MTAGVTTNHLTTMLTSENFELGTGVTIPSTGAVTRVRARATIEHYYQSTTSIPIGGPASTMAFAWATTPGTYPGFTGALTIADEIAIAIAPTNQAMSAWQTSDNESRLFWTATWDIDFQNVWIPGGSWEPYWAFNDREVTNDDWSAGDLWADITVWWTHS